MSDKIERNKLRKRQALLAQRDYKQKGTAKYFEGDSKNILSLTTTNTHIIDNYCEPTSEPSEEPVLTEKQEHMRNWFQQHFNPENDEIDEYCKWRKSWQEKTHYN